MLAQRITYVGELGFELYVAPEWAVQCDRLLESGEPHGIEPGGYRVLDSPGSRRATATLAPT